MYQSALGLILDQISNSRIESWDLVRIDKYGFYTIISFASDETRGLTLPSLDAEASNHRKTPNKVEGWESPNPVERLDPIHTSTYSHKRAGWKAT